MNSHIRFAILLLIAALTPTSASAALIFSDLKLFAVTKDEPQGFQVSDTEFVPDGGSGSVEVLSRAPGAPFPKLPNSVSSAFASAAELTLAGNTLSGVGVNGFFLRNSLPPNKLSAFASVFQSINNDSTTDTESVRANFFIPAPTMQFFGVGDFFPAGADPARDAFALVEARLIADIRQPSGGVIQHVLLDYGMKTFRNPLTGVFSAIPLGPDSVGLTRFDEPDGSFGFRLPALTVDLALPEIGPGDSLELLYLFNADASTGFGETGIFAAIGDPFNLSASGVGFDLQIGDAVEPEPVTGIPAPSTLAALGLGIVLLSVSARRSPFTSAPKL